MSKLGEAEQLFANFRATAEKGDIAQAKVSEQSTIYDTWYARDV